MIEVTDLYIVYYNINIIMIEVTDLYIVYYKKCKTQRLKSYLSQHVFLNMFVGFRLLMCGMDKDQN